ncbi:hypothetical protein ACIOD2_44110 [Amycolatopsis sp. NPDC088138]|uniref:hypothetical protein n=1 Tax=Amycolatopsis sp. NPDC088138 TaxID=3363938 RepID=UPI003815000E
MNARSEDENRSAVPLRSVDNSISGDVFGLAVQAGAINGPITVTVAGAVSVPLDDAVCDLEPVLAAVLDHRFTGREWLIAEIDQFVQRRRCGYLWIEAQAGLGKSALAAHLVRERAWIGHFSRVSRGGTTQVGLQNLAGQLVKRYELWDSAPGRMLPERAFTPEGFERILGRAARCAREEGKPLVLVVDGANETEQADGMQPWGLPVDLPVGVFVVGTYRTGFVLPPARPSRIMRIEAEDPRNHEDVAQHLDAVLRDEDFVRRLKLAGLTRQQFGADLAERCGGVWVYLRYVLDEIRYGLRDPGQLDSLPADLTSYYTSSLEQWSGHPRWHDEILPLLATLAVAGEPLSTGMLTAVSGVGESAVRLWCHGVLRPFLAATRHTSLSASEGSPKAEHAKSRGFAIYHASMRELLTGILQHDRDADRSWMWSELLRSATTLAHQRIIEYYVGLFGGWDGDLALLADDPGLAARDGGYALRHLARHLVRAGRGADLHRLLRVERPIGRNRATNLWFAAHDAVDTIDQYLADVATARQDCQYQTELALDADRPAPSLAGELRYWLIAASVVSHTTNVPIVLLQSLVRHQVWTVDRALAHARRLPTAETRSDALAAIFRYISVEQQALVLTEVLTELTAVSDASARVRTLADLIPHLAVEERAARLIDAFADAVTIADTNRRAGALRELMPHVPGDKFAEALAAATAEGPERLRVLVQMTQHVANRHRKLLDVIASIVFGEDRAPVVAARFDLNLPAGEQLEVVAQALAAAIAVTFGSYYVLPLAEVLPQLPAKRRVTVLDRVLPQAVAVADEAARARILAELLPHALATQRHDVFALALTAALSVRSESQRAGALARLAPHLPPGRHVDVLAAADEMFDEAARVQVLVGMLPHLSDEQRPKALTRTLTTAEGIEDEVVRVQALVSLLPLLPVDQQPTVLGEAMATGCAITNEALRIFALAELVPSVPAGRLVEVLAAVTTFTDGLARFDALLGLLPYVDNQAGPAARAEAWAAATAADEYVGILRLVDLAPHLSAEQVAELVTMIVEFETEDAQAGSFVELAPYLSVEQMAEVMATTLGMTDHASRLRALTRLFPFMSPEQQRVVMASISAVDGETIRSRAPTRVERSLSDDRSTTVSSAVLNQAGTVHAVAPEPGEQAAGVDVRVLRARFQGVDRAAALHALVPLVPALQSVAGHGFAGQVVMVMRDVYRWWA